MKYTKNQVHIRAAISSKHTKNWVVDIQYDHEEKDLKRWFKEKWKDIGHKSYPVYRPTVRVNKNTPFTVNEIDKKQMQNQISLKQIIKENHNLPPFKAK
jgi:hypothetical protein